MSQDKVKPWQVLSQRLLHSAACSASGVTHLLHQWTDRWQRPQAPFAAITGGEEGKERRKERSVSESAATEGSPTTNTEQGMTPEQLKQLNRAKLAYFLKKLQKKKVKVDGKRTNLLELARQIAHERKVKEVAGDEPQIRDKSHAELKASIPPEERRPGAYKMQLRPEEEEELALDLLARGMTFSPRRFTGNLLGGRRDLVFGIYGRADEARLLLDEKWSGLPLEYVMGEAEFFEDVLDNAAQLELTVMAIPVRPLPLAPLRDNLCQRLTLRLGEGGKKALQEEDAETAEEASPSEAYAQLQMLANTFSDEGLRGSAIVDKQGNLVPDSHFIFSTLPDSSLLAEVITPGTLRDRKTFKAGHWKSKQLTRAVFDLFLGPASLDDQARVQAGQALLYFTNGFKLSDDPSLRNQAFLGDDGKAMWRKPSTDVLEPSLDIFSLQGEGETAQLVNNVERRRQVFGSLGLLSQR